jgi:hypothetical protein
MTTAKSAYPTPVEELLPQARELVDKLGRVPGRNQLMAELRIGAKKARAILDQLHAERQDTTEAQPEPESGGSARLHLVAEPTETTPADTDTDRADGPGSSDLTEAVSGPEAGESGPESRPAVDVDQDAPREPVSEPITTVADPAGPAPATRPGKAVPVWPVLLLALPAFVAIWSGWVGLGGLTGFGIVHPLPGIADEFAINTAITLPIGVETYAAYALRVWLSGQVPVRARRFAKYSALGSLVLGALGQIAYHLMKAAGMDAAPWPITALVACLPVAVLGMGAGLAHLIKDDARPEVAR